MGVLLHQRGGGDCLLCSVVVLSHQRERSRLSSLKMRFARGFCYLRLFVAYNESFGETFDLNAICCRFGRFPTRLNEFLDYYIVMHLEIFLYLELER